ncbi:hypothetical protein [Cesiribacter andamanensis]|uniref:Uncharacterized protein n=1 Tax=Cesiribacter andamanensis AMV16 TaxID=1279009 RepID=M7NW06_9BACT|nr:hypothetical protein [Cesiribacter andamanensis]EMR02649.1 hypothetical protein ADICEAN_02188 [Cesiribacter andamanensis AMV16]
MKNTDKTPPSTQRSVVDKVASGERASLADQSLTPERKVAAEQKRMQLDKSQAPDRREEDRQVANLGKGEVLTPARKVAKDSQRPS